MASNKSWLPFMHESSASDPDGTHVPPENYAPQTEGDLHVQDHHSGPSAGSSTDARTPSAEVDGASNRESLRRNAEEETRGLEASSLPGEAGQQPKPDRERSPGTSSG